MSNTQFNQQAEISAPVEELFAYHERPNAFKRLNPPWEPVQIVVNDGHIRDGARVELKLSIGPIPQYFRLIHKNYRHNEQFEDHQVTGPFAYWVHRHKMQALGADRSRLEDAIEYRLPLGILGKIFGGAFAHAKLERMFKFRHEVTRQDLALHQQYKDRPRQKVAITGASGLIGGQLLPFLTTGGHEVKRLVRQKSEAGAPEAIYWNPAAGELNPGDLAGLDAVIHLAGENIGAKRWTEEQKRAILDSRTQGTRLLAESLAALPAEQRPKVLIAASAVGYYGDRGAEVLSETSPAGDNFQAEVCKAWEAALQPAIDAGIRVVILRIGVVLDMRGGALQKMLLPFLLGAGGPLGSGQQYMTWIALDDVIGIIHHALMHPEMQGVYNASAPQALTNREYTKVLGRVLRRPTFAPVPGFALRLLFGKLSDELLLGSLRASAEKIQAAGYQFRYAELEPALRHALGR
jgi:hypothetical protein